LTGIETISNFALQFSPILLQCSYRSEEDKFYQLTKLFYFMKKRIIFIALMLCFIGSYSFAIKHKDINEAIKASFRKEFVNAEVVHWENLGDFVRVDFAMNDQFLQAYFHLNGELIAVTRNILSNELPIHLIIDLNKEYSAYWITDLFEISTEGGTSYYITLHNSNLELVLRSDEVGSWEVFKKVIIIY